MALWLCSDSDICDYNACFLSLICKLKLLTYVQFFNNFPRTFGGCAAFKLEPYNINIIVFFSGCIWNYEPHMLLICPSGYAVGTYEQHMRFIISYTPFKENNNIIIHHEKKTIIYTPWEYILYCTVNLYSMFFNWPL